MKNHDIFASVLRRGIAAAALAVTVSACSNRIDVTGTIPHDYRERHPIQLVKANETMDIFVGNQSGDIGVRQQQDVRHFARSYMENGQGPLIAYLPTGGNNHGVSAGLNSIRNSLAGGGAGGRLQIAHYHPDTPGAAPIKLVYAKLTAQTPNKCGYESEEIIQTRFSANMQNTQSRNFGCTYQQNLAAQIADPRDLVRPRQDGPVDVNKRLAGIERLRTNPNNELKPAGTKLKEGIQ
ncbi:MAG: CpaD family pilus assembly protein [Beijerinckiaceae bacterium]